MEAPKKVYIDDFGSGFSHGWHTEHSYEKDIEYVRKDAFIEKAKKWLYLQLNEINMEGEDMENFLKDFKSYMKGE
jgi:hypothetical protein